MLRGEVGVGKRLLARLIHRAGPRPDGPFVVFDCTAIPESGINADAYQRSRQLLESKLFGYKKIGYIPGSLTEPTFSVPGMIERAHRGTLFLDNVTELPQGLLGKLLKAFEHRRVRRLGDTRDKPIDVWVLAATDQDLREAIDSHRRYRETFNLPENETFVMENLYQQLGKRDVLIPPLRQRPDDILLIAEHSRACLR